MTLHQIDILVVIFCPQSNSLSDFLAGVHKKIQLLEKRNNLKHHHLNSLNGLQQNLMQIVFFSRWKRTQNWQETGLNHLIQIFQLPIVDVLDPHKMGSIQLVCLPLGHHNHPPDTLIGLSIIHLEDHGPHRANKSQTPLCQHKAYNTGQRRNFQFHQFTNPLVIKTENAIQIPERINYIASPPSTCSNRPRRHVKLASSNEYMEEGCNKKNPLRVCSLSSFIRDSRRGSGTHTKNLLPWLTAPTIIWTQWSRRTRFPTVCIRSMATSICSLDFYIKRRLMSTINRTDPTKRRCYNDTQLAHCAISLQITRIH